MTTTCMTLRYAACVGGKGDAVPLQQLPWRTLSGMFLETLNTSRPVNSTRRNVHVYTHARARARALKNALAQIQRHASAHTHAHTQTRTHTRIHTHMRTYARTRTHTCNQAQKHMHTHTRPRSFTCTEAKASGLKVNKAKNTSTQLDSFSKSVVQ